MADLKQTILDLIKDKDEKQNSASSLYAQILKELNSSLVILALATHREAAATVASLDTPEAKALLASIRKSHSLCHELDAHNISRLVTRRIADNTASISARLETLIQHSVNPTSSLSELYNTLNDVLAEVQKRHSRSVFISSLKKKVLRGLCAIGAAILIVTVACNELPGKLVLSERQVIFPPGPYRTDSTADLTTVPLDRGSYFEELGDYLFEKKGAFPLRLDPELSRRVDESCKNLRLDKRRLTRDEFLRSHQWTETIDGPVQDLRITFANPSFWRSTFIGNLRIEAIRVTPTHFNWLGVPSTPKVLVGVETIPFRIGLPRESADAKSNEFPRLAPFAAGGSWSLSLISEMSNGRFWLNTRMRVLANNGQEPIQLWAYDPIEFHPQATYHDPLLQVMPTSPACDDAWQPTASTAEYRVRSVTNRKQLVEYKKDVYSLSLPDESEAYLFPHMFWRHSKGVDPNAVGGFMHEGLVFEEVETVARLRELRGEDNVFWRANVELEVSHESLSGNSYKRVFAAQIPADRVAIELHEQLLQSDPRHPMPCNAAPRCAPGPAPMSLALAAIGATPHNMDAGENIIIINCEVAARDTRWAVSEISVPVNKSLKANGMLVIHLRARMAQSGQYLIKTMIDDAKIDSFRLEIEVPPVLDHVSGNASWIRSVSDELQIGR